MSHRKLSEQEKRIWEAAAKHVRRLDKAQTPQAVISDELSMPSDFHALASKDSSAPLKSKRQRLVKPPPHPIPATPAPALSASQIENRQNEKRVRRGKQDVSASFDLHGFTQKEAWQALPQFLQRERVRGSRCVIVITGKGRSGEGVLRHNFLRWLDMPEARQAVSGYAPAHAKHGGGGAWYVYLRKL